MKTTLSSLNMPLRPTWRRYKDIFLENRNISIYRALEYEALSQVSFCGRILDFGGGQRAHYTPMLKSWIKEGFYESANISAEMEPTYLMDANGRLPVADSTFDMVLSVNTLEHVYNLQGTLEELVRALKPGGRMILAVPFLYRVHGCPDDFNRPTASWWLETLRKLPLSQLAITPLVWDVMVSGLSVTEGAGPFTQLRRAVIPLYGLLYAQMKGKSFGDRYSRETGESLANFALGYIVNGVKSG